MTESIYNNSLADHHLWSTIKTLPATLPEPRFAVRGPRSLGRETLTGVTVDVSESGLDLIIGGGAAGRRGLRLRGSLLRLVGGFKS